MRPGRFASSWARALTALALVVPLAARGEDGEGAAQAARTPPAPPEVTMAPPLVRRLTERDEFTGRFEPVRQVDVRPRVSGYVEQVHFDDGQIVEAGQLLSTINPRPCEATVDRLKAEIEQAEAQLRLAQLEQSRAQRLVSTSATARATLDQR